MDTAAQLSGSESSRSQETIDDALPASGALHLLEVDAGSGTHIRHAAERNPSRRPARAALRSCRPSTHGPPAPRAAGACPTRARCRRSCETPASSRSARSGWSPATASTPSTPESLRPVRRPPMKTPPAQVAGGASRIWSTRPDSNRRPSRWQRDALPAELLVPKARRRYGTRRPASRGPRPSARDSLYKSKSSRPTPQGNGRLRQPRRHPVARRSGRSARPARAGAGRRARRAPRRARAGGRR